MSDQVENYFKKKSVYWICVEGLKKLEVCWSVWSICKIVCFMSLGNSLLGQVKNKYFHLIQIICT